MNELDADDGLLTYQGRKAQRDIVQVSWFFKSLLGFFIVKVVINIGKKSI